MVDVIAKRLFQFGDPAEDAVAHAVPPRVAEPAFSDERLVEVKCWWNRGCRISHDGNFGCWCRVSLFGVRCRSNSGGVRVSIFLR